VGRRCDNFEGPCLALADELAHLGYPGDGAVIREALPHPNIASDQHVEELVRRLNAIAARGRLPSALRAAAADLADRPERLPELIGRRGRAWVVSNDSPHRHDPLTYGCSWQPDDDDPDLYGDAEIAELDDALAWAFRRAPVVIVEPHNRGGQRFLAATPDPSSWTPTNDF
jgi:hypothetical protein